MVASEKYDHKITVDSQRKLVVIERVFRDGRSSMYTELNLAVLEGESPNEALMRCGRQLGEDLLLDSAAARLILKL